MRLHAAYLLVCSACSRSEAPPDPARVLPEHSGAASAVAAPAPAPAPVGSLSIAGAALERVERPRSQRTRRFVSLPTGEPTFEPKRLRTEDMPAATLAPLYTKRDTRVDHFRFEGFDADWLLFVFVSWARVESIKVRPRVDRRVRVARTAQAESVLRVASTVDFFEVGEGGVRGGMSAQEVARVLGTPLAELTLGAFGNCDFVYRDRTVRFLQNRVAFVSAPYPEPISSGSTPSGHCAGRLGQPLR